MGCFIPYARVELGDCCLGTLAPGRPFTITSDFGPNRVIGRPFTTCCAMRCAYRQVSVRNPPPRFWTARPCARQTRAGSEATTQPRKPRGSSATSRSEAVRIQAGKRKEPTAAILDSQTVRSADQGGERGYDAAKKTKGIKRHILVDTLGLLLGVCVTPADV